MDILPLDQVQISELNGLHRKKLSDLSDIEIEQLVKWWHQRWEYDVEINLFHENSTLTMIAVPITTASIAELKHNDVEIRVILPPGTPTTDPFNDVIKLQISTGLKSERERLNLTQEGFGLVAGASKRTVIDWEKGITSPTAYQLYKLVQSGFSVMRLFTLASTSTSSNQPLASTTTKNLRLIYNDVNFVERTGDYVLDAINQIHSVFQQHPTYQLLNIETKYDKTGREVGLRYFYYYPVEPRPSFKLGKLV